MSDAFAVAEYLHETFEIRFEVRCKGNKLNRRQWAVTLGLPCVLNVVNALTKAKVPADAISIYLHLLYYCGTDLRDPVPPEFLAERLRKDRSFVDRHLHALLSNNIVRASDSVSRGLWHFRTYKSLEQYLEANQWVAPESNGVIGQTAAKAREVEVVNGASVDVPE